MYLFASDQNGAAGFLSASVSSQQLDDGTSSPIHIILFNNKLEQ